MPRPVPPHAGEYGVACARSAVNPHVAVGQDNATGVEGVGGPRDDPLEPRGGDTLANVADACPEVVDLGVGPPVGVVGLLTDVENICDTAVDDELDGSSDRGRVINREVTSDGKVWRDEVRVGRLESGQGLGVRVSADGDYDAGSARSLTLRRMSVAIRMVTGVEVEAVRRVAQRIVEVRGRDFRLSLEGPRGPAADPSAIHRARRPDKPDEGACLKTG